MRREGLRKVCSSLLLLALVLLPAMTSSARGFGLDEGFWPAVFAWFTEVLVKEGGYIDPDGKTGPSPLPDGKTGPSSLPDGKTGPGLIPDGIPLAGDPGQETRSAEKSSSAYDPNGRS